MDKNVMRFDMFTMSVGCLVSDAFLLRSAASSPDSTTSCLPAWPLTSAPPAHLL